MDYFDATGVRLEQYSKIANSVNNTKDVRNWVRIVSQETTKNLHITTAPKHDVLSQTASKNNYNT
jgi:hypothetical protein